MKKITMAIIFTLLAIIASCSNSSGRGESEGESQGNRELTRDEIIQQMQNYINEINKYKQVQSQQVYPTDTNMKDYNETLVNNSGDAIYRYNQIKNSYNLDDLKEELRVIKMREGQIKVYYEKLADKQKREARPDLF